MSPWITFAGLGLIIEILFIRQEYAGKKVHAVVLKGFASLVFVILGVVYFTQATYIAYARLILIGLVFGMLGDILLNLRYCYTGDTSNKIFAGGIAAFLAGHLLYISALVLRAFTALYWGVPISVLLSLLLIPVLLKNINPPGKGLKIFGIIYLIIVTTMFSFASALLINQPGSSLNLVFTIGAMLFMASDFILIYNLFGKKKIRCLRAVNLICYYISQLLIAITISLK